MYHEKDHSAEDTYDGVKLRMILRHPTFSLHGVGASVQGVGPLDRTCPELHVLTAVPLAADMMRLLLAVSFDTICVNAAWNLVVTSQI